MQKRRFLFRRTIPLERTRMLCYNQYGFLSEQEGTHSMQKIRTTVKIAGKEYNIAGYDSEAHVQRVAAHVDRKMNELSITTRLPAAQLAVLAAVNATDDMIKSRDEIRRLRQEVESLRAALEKKNNEE